VHKESPSSERPPMDNMVMYLRFQQNAKNFLTSSQTIIFLKSAPFKGAKNFLTSSQTIIFLKSAPFKGVSRYMCVLVARIRLYLKELFKLTCDIIQQKDN
jgi:hypothetical protein